jgi:hypothetical protein
MVNFMLAYFNTTEQNELPVSLSGLVLDSEAGLWEFRRLFSPKSLAVAMETNSCF